MLHKVFILLAHTPFKENKVMGYDTRDKGFLQGIVWYRIVLGIWGTGVIGMIATGIWAIATKK